MTLAHSCSFSAQALALRSVQLDSQYELTEKKTEYFTYIEKSGRHIKSCVDLYEFKLGTIPDVMKLLGCSHQTAVSATKELWDVGLIYKKSPRSGFYVSPYLIRKEGINKTKQFCETDYFKKILKIDHELKLLT